MFIKGYVFGVFLTLLITTAISTISISFASPDIQFTSMNPDHFAGTINGQSFEMKTVLQEPRIMHYSGPEGDYFMTDKGKVEADSLIQALSIYFTL